MNLSINPYALGYGPAASLAGDGSASPVGLEAVPCPSCGREVVPNGTGWQACPSCEKGLQIYAWPVVRRNAVTAMALSDQATCFFHPDRAFLACCQGCGRFVCALCDLQLGAEHVCPICFERGRAESDAVTGKAEWRHRDVHYDSIAFTAGWAWILFWPTIIAAIPTVIFLHVKYRKAPRSYLIPRSGWRFWVAYVGILWLPLLFSMIFLAGRMAGRH